ncbi:glycosyltransferase family 4 protein [Candidatus Parcubacteria bacterium]|nr:glycosyltransferase family 4 protein [Candidatus Parcubacteria bacterium]
MHSKRILIFSLSYYPLVGGAEVAIREITNRLPDYEFDMITMRFDSLDKPEERIGNVNVYRVGNGSSYINKILFVPRAVFKAWKLNREKGYGKFWAMMTNMVFPISVLRIFGNRTPYVLTLQDGDPFEYVFERLRIRIFSPLLRYGFKHASVVQPISTFLANWATKMGCERIEIVPNGVNVEHFTKGGSQSEQLEVKREIGKMQGDIFLVSSSRLVRKNGLEDVVSALTYLPENISFINFGVGPEKNNLLTLAKKLGVERKVRLFDHPGNDMLPKYFHASDIFIRPSLSEGQGISFLEGMAAGLPVIATPVGGIPDFLFDPDKTPHKPPTGLFVNVHDPESIARQVTRLINNPNLRETLVVNAKRMVREKYDWNLIAEQMKKRVFEPVL